MKSRVDLRVHFAAKLAEWEKEFGGRLPKQGDPRFDQGENSLLGKVVKEALSLGVKGEQLAEVLEDLAAVAHAYVSGLALHKKEKQDG